jgi:protein SCO1/2
MMRKVPAEKVQVLFVTVDPERDTAELLKNYVPAFYPSFLAMRGTEEQTKAMLQRFNVFAEKHYIEDGEYSVDHSSTIYVYDTKGKIRLAVPYGSSAEAMAEDVNTLLAEG